MNMNVKKVALVTGAASGIGYACAIRMAKAGFDVAINCYENMEGASSCANEIAQLGCDYVIIKADVSKEDEVKKMFKIIVDKWGRVDAIINNAGIFKASYLFKQQKESLDRLIEINSLGCVWVSKIGMKYMIPQRYGKIVNISSISAITGMVGESAYSLTKGAINAFSKAISKEAASYGINVNVIAPGYIKTNITDRMPDDERQKAIARLPIGHFGEPGDVAELACFLASDCSKYIVGQVIAIDGGYSA